MKVPLETALPIAKIGNGVPVIELASKDVSPFFFESISIWQVLMIIWLTGEIVFLAYHTVKHYRFIKLVRRWSESITDGQAFSMLESLKTEMGITKQIGLQKCPSVGSPMMIGFIHPKILLPKADFADDELRFILSHELVHYKRKDLWYKVLVLMATAIHWFNPIVYIAARAIDIECELSCDDEVIHGTDVDIRQHYIETIIGVVKYQSKMKTMLSTNFYGGKKGMKKRIFSIMDTSKKKTGAAILCGMLILTLGTGVAFAANAATESAPENAPITNVATADENQNTETIKWEPLPEYEQFGISYNANGKMLFNGQVVRYFWDGYEIEPGMNATHYDYLNEAGIIDVHTVRSIIGNGDGSVDMFGALMNIVAYSQREFDARDIKEIGRNPVATAVNGGSDIGGRTFTEIFSDYKDYGIEFVASTTGGIGNIYYQGQLVKTFIDEDNNGGVFTLQSIGGGNITVRTVYDASGNLTGVTVDN